MLTWVIRNDDKHIIYTLSNQSVSKEGAKVYTGLVYPHLHSHSFPQKSLSPNLPVIALEEEVVGERVYSTQKGLSRVQAQNLLAVSQQCQLLHHRAAP